MTTTTTWNIAQLERHAADGIVYTALVEAPLLMKWARH
jgi:hypothetical protein